MLSKLGRLSCSKQSVFFEGVVKKDFFVFRTLNMKGSLKSSALTVVKEGFTELKLSSGSAEEWIPVWTVLNGMAPIEGIREAWEECSIVFFPTTRVTLFFFFSLLRFSKKLKTEAHSTRHL